MDFNEITQAMLEDYEGQYFDSLDVPGMRGVHRNASGNIQSAVNAGWIAAPDDKMTSLDRMQLSKDIDAKYREFTVIDPNG